MIYLGFRSEYELRSIISVKEALDIAKQEGMKQIGMIFKEGNGIIYFYTEALKEGIKPIIIFEKEIDFNEIEQIEELEEEKLENIQVKGAEEENELNLSKLRLESKDQLDSNRLIKNGVNRKKQRVLLIPKTYESYLTIIQNRYILEDNNIFKIFFPKNEEELNELEGIEGFLGIENLDDTYTSSTRERIAIPSFSFLAGDREAFQIYKKLANIDFEGHSLNKEEILKLLEFDSTAFQNAVKVADSVNISINLKTYEIENAPKILKELVYESYKTLSEKSIREKEQQEDSEGKEDGKKEVVEIEISQEKENGGKKDEKKEEGQVGHRYKENGYDKLVRERIEYELDIIEKKGLGSYFLLVKDILDIANELDILSNIRGSASSSLLLYLLNISKIDPLEYNLYFDRFLNLRRVDMPDVDIDVEQHKRDLLISKINERYKSYSLIVYSKLTKYILDSKLSSLKMYRRSQDFKRDMQGSKDNYADNIDKNNIYDRNVNKEDNNIDLSNLDGYFSQIFSKLENKVYYQSLHHVGLVFDSLEEIVPINKGVALLNSEELEKIKGIKIDILGVKALSLINSLCKVLNLKLEDIPKDDKKSYSLLSLGNTDSIFQLESESAKRVLISVKPKNMEDVSLVLALNRPGVKANGSLIYQEQLIEYFVKQGNSVSESEILAKKAIKGDKDSKEEKSNLSYLFNKSHAVSYAHISYYLAYFKANYPKEFESFTGLKNTLSNLNTRDLNTPKLFDLKEKNKRSYATESKLDEVKSEKESINSDVRKIVLDISFLDNRDELKRLILNNPGKIEVVVKLNDQVLNLKYMINKEVIEEIEKLLGKEKIEKVYRG